MGPQEGPRRKPVSSVRGAGEKASAKVFLPALLGGKKKKKKKTDLGSVARAVDRAALHAACKRQQGLLRTLRPGRPTAAFVAQAQRRVRRSSRKDWHRSIFRAGRGMREDPEILLAGPPVTRAGSRGARPVGRSQSRTRSPVSSRLTARGLPRPGRSIMPTWHATSQAHRRRQPLAPHMGSAARPPSAPRWA